MKLSKDLLEWANFDDCCHVDKEKNCIVSYHDTNPFDKEEEKRFILQRIESLYDAGGVVETINIVPLRQTHPIDKVHSLNELDWEYSEADCDGLPASERNKFDCSCCC
jgi:hypothetical protein